MIQPSRSTFGRAVGTIGAVPNASRRRVAAVVSAVLVSSAGVVVATDASAATSTASSRGARLAATKNGPCRLLTTSELHAALGSTFTPKPPYHVGTGITCAYIGIGPVRGATVRVARGKQANVAMASTLRALRVTLQSVSSRPPSKVAGLGKKAYYSLDAFLGEGGIVVLDGKTFVQVTAIVSPNGDTALVSEDVLKRLAKKGLTRAR